MQKTVKQICKEQGILGQIILERWEKHFLDIDSVANSFSKCISDIATLEVLDKRLNFDRLYNMIAEEEFKPKSLAEQLIESSGLREAVGKMQVLAENPKEFAEKARQSFENPVIEPTKSISKGSIVTIDGKEYELQGDAVLVEPLSELIQGKRYLIRYTENFCHVSRLYGKYHLMANQAEAFFVGSIFLPNYGERFFFYDGDGSYFMFGNEISTVCSKFDFTVKQLD